MQTSHGILHDYFMILLKYFINFCTYDIAKPKCAKKNFFFRCSVSKWWLPLIWAGNIVKQARESNNIKSDPAVQTLLGELCQVRKGLFHKNNRIVH